MPVVVPASNGNWQWWSQGTTTSSTVTWGPNSNIMYSFNTPPAITGAATYEWMRSRTYLQYQPGPVNDASVARARRAAQERHREQTLLRESAGDKARATLMSLLNADQREQFERGRSFDVVGSDGGRYRINPGIAQNIVDLGWEDPHEGNVLCAHPRMYVEGGQLPTEDAMIAQLLMLRFNEPGFLAIANRS